MYAHIYTHTYTHTHTHTHTYLQLAPQAQALRSHFCLLCTQCQSRGRCRGDPLGAAGRDLDSCPTLPPHSPAHTSAYVSIRQHTSAEVWRRKKCRQLAQSAALRPRGGVGPPTLVARRLRPPTLVASSLRPPTLVASSLRPPTLVASRLMPPTLASSGFPSLPTHSPAFFL
jgi:hypothetical protein